jgi:hypothetical protein
MNCLSPLSPRENGARFFGLLALCFNPFFGLLNVVWFGALKEQSCGKFEGLESFFNREL